MQFMEEKLRKMMVVEDMPYQREAMVAMLSCLHEETVFAAENGVAASKILRKHHREIDVIFTDLQMPEMDGLQLIEFLGELHYRGCVFICSHMDQKIIDLAIELARRKAIHLVGCLDKELNEELLIAMFERVRSVKAHYFPYQHLIKKNELLEALLQKSVVPYFQPQIDSRTRRVKGFEVLSRIILPGTKQTLTPDYFIPVANKYAMANMLTMSLLEVAIAEFKQIIKVTGRAGLNMSFNICPSQLDDDDMPNELFDLCQHLEFPTENLVIEITESDVIETDKRLKNLNRLRLLGFGCSLDDFGMGFTSIRQIHNYPFTEVKMDKSLLLGIELDHYAQRLYDHLYYITQEYEMSLIIEGVETHAQASYFNKYPDVLLQGYLITHPKPIEEITHWYRAWSDQFTSSSSPF